MELVTPSVKYKDSFLQAVVEYQQEKVKRKNHVYFLDVIALQKDFEKYVNQLQDEDLGRNLPSGYVSHTMYWLVESIEVIGTVDVRHALTEDLLRFGGHIGYDIRPSKRNQGYGKKILELTLPKVKVIGLSKVLVTCDEDNLASKKIIESNGGVFENSVYLGEGLPRKLRYWITLS